MENQNNEIEEFNPYLDNGGNKKHFFWDILKPILSGLGGVIVIGLFILGDYHSCTKHKDDSELITYTPLAIYRGVEFFWHNDFAGVNWEERLKEDGKSCIHFLNQAIDKSINPHELNKNIEIFSKDINKYPKDKLEILKTVSKFFIEYSMTFYINVQKAMKYYFNNREINLSYSGEILTIESKLKKYLPQEYFEQIRNTMEESYKQIKESFPKLDDLDETDKNDRLNTIENGVNLLKLKFDSAYKKIFNEDM